jgi:transposase
VLCEAPTWKIDDLSDRLDYTRLQTRRLLGRLREQGLATNSDGEWRAVAKLQPDQLDAIRKMFPAHRTLIKRIQSTEYVTHRELNQSQRDTAKLLVKRGLLATTERRSLLAYELAPLCVSCLPVIQSHE